MTKQTKKCFHFSFLPQISSASFYEGVFFGIEIAKFPVEDVFNWIFYGIYSGFNNHVCPLPNIVFQIGVSPLLDETL
jgi:hypothetical protein